MVQFFDIQYWHELSWYNTGGTRAKKIVQSPENENYYFKRSQYKPASGGKAAKDFTYEFWSEIIAYEVGTLLGFDVLKYDIAYDGTSLGCFSKSMLDSEKEQFIEGIKLLQANNSNYDPSNKEHRKLYTFQEIEEALDNFLFNRFKKNIVEVIIFDAIIGNGDRHQENWAIIMEYSAISEALARFEKLTSESGSAHSKSDIFDFSKIRFSPIYDSGSSLGRELTDSAVDEFLLLDTTLIRYIERGLAEIHWNNRKITHYQLIANLLNTNYKETVVNTINRVVSKFNLEAIESVIEKVDIWIPAFLQKHKLPETRKRFIIKLISLRVLKLKELIYA